MDGSRRYDAIWNKAEKDKYCMISLMWNLRSKTKGKKTTKKTPQILLFYLFIHERHTERSRDIGRGRNRLPAGTLMWDSILRFWEEALPLSHPGILHRFLTIENWWFPERRWGGKWNRWRGLRAHLLWWAQSHIQNGWITIVHLMLM